MNPFRLAFRVLRGDRRTRISTLLTAVGVAIATALVLLLAALPAATKARAARAQWQQPHHTASSAAVATMLVATNTDFTGGRQITVVDGAPTKQGTTIRLPPGVPVLPGPGEMVVSPAFFELLHALPPAQLADRFPARVVGTFTDAALEYPDQLVALVGYTPDTAPPVPRWRWPDSVTRRTRGSTNHCGCSPASAWSCCWCQAWC